jgi:hypothetical protein
MVGMINIAGGLSAMGGALSNWAHDAGLQQMQIELEHQNLLLSDQLLRSREAETFRRSISPEAQQAAVDKEKAIAQARLDIDTSPKAISGKAAVAAAERKTPEEEAATTRANEEAQLAVRSTPEALALRGKEAAINAQAQQSAEYSPASIAGATKKQQALAAAKMEADLAKLGPGVTLDQLADLHAENVMANIYNLNNITDEPSGLRNAVGKAILDLRQANPNKLTPKQADMLSRVAVRIASPETSSSQYKLALDALPYLEKIKSGLANPGTGDEEALDGLIKLSNSGGAVTEAQVKLITGSASYSDWLNIMINRFHEHAGILSPEQRNQIKKISDATYDAYEKGVQPLYESAVAKLKEQNIPPSLYPIMDVKQMTQKIRAALDEGEAKTAPVTGAGVPVTGAPLPTGPHGEQLKTDGSKFFYRDIVTKKWTEYQP